MGEEFASLGLIDIYISTSRFDRHMVGLYDELVKSVVYLAISSFCPDDRANTSPLFRRKSYIHYTSYCGVEVTQFIGILDLNDSQTATKPVSIEL